MCLDTLVFEVYAKKQLTKDNLVGTVELHLASTESAKLDDWLPIKGSHGGTLRVSVAVSNDNVLAKKEYDNLVKLITEPNLELVTAFGRETNCKEAYAKILVDIMVSERKDFEFLKTLIKNEIEATENSSIIFRGNSLASKAIDYYMKLVGSVFLISTLQGPILTILRSKDHCEIDETKLEIKIPTKLSKCALLFDDNDVATVQTEDPTKSIRSVDKATNNSQIIFAARNTGL